MIIHLKIRPRSPELLARVIGKPFKTRSHAPIIYSCNRYRVSDSSPDPIRDLELESKSGFGLAVVFTRDLKSDLGLESKSGFGLVFARVTCWVFRTRVQIRSRTRNWIQCRTRTWYQNRTPCKLLPDFGRSKSGFGLV